MFFGTPAEDGVAKQMTHAVPLEFRIPWHLTSLPVGSTAKLITSEAACTPRVLNAKKRAATFAAALC